MKKKPEVKYTFTDGVIFPDTTPRGGELITVVPTTRRSFLTIHIGLRGRVRFLPEYFDVLCFTDNFGRDEVLVQVLPTDNPSVGRLRYLSRSTLVNNLRSSGRRSFDNLDLYFF